jgi:hypothetical protein
MVSITEQAKQSPMNATPLGRDPLEIEYPSVNTCVTVTAVCPKNLIGLHLGLMMGAEKSADSTMIDLAHLGLYLQVLGQHIKVNGGGNASKVYIAGALAVWKDNASALWNSLKTEALKLAGNSSKLDMLQFDDTKAETVDIRVSSKGVQFTKVGERTSLVSADPKFVG